MMEAPGFWETLRMQMNQPEYLHVLIHPLLIYGFALGILGLIAALFLRHRRAEVVALLVVLASALAAWPAAHYGNAAYDGMIGSLSETDKDGAAWLDEHLDRGEDYLWVFHSVAALAALALILPVWLPRTGRPLAVLVLLASVAAFGCGAWIGQAGGKIRHKEFRYGPPPQPSSDE